MDTTDLWRFLPADYLFTVALEAPVLWLLLSPRHPPRRRLLAGFWLTACTYPVVVLVLPVLLEGATRAAYILTAELFAPAAECLLFRAAFGTEDPATCSSTRRDFAAIVAANLASFAFGEFLFALK